MMKYYKGTSLLRQASPSVKLMALGSLPAIFGILAFILWKMLFELQVTVFGIDIFFSKLYKGLFVLTAFIEIIGIITWVRMPDREHIKYMIQKYLFTDAYGNPLHFKEGEYLPEIMVKDVDEGHKRYEIIIPTLPKTIDELQNASPSISILLKSKFRNYAVVWTEPDEASRYVSFYIEDVTTSRKLFANSAEELRQNSLTKLIVQEGTYIDLTTSGSMIVAGKTRSGKTTGIISLLLQVLLSGPDRQGSEVIVVDPKSAELSCLPYVYSPDENSGAKNIFQAVKRFEETRMKRQRVLNDLSKKDDVIHWWDAGMNVSILFLDEFVALRSLFPKKASKDDPGYSLEAFDEMIKRIITMGASAGCYVIISIAEASVGEAGLPNMIKNACSTRILYRPTTDEGSFLWNRENLKDFPPRTYLPGDAWFSSTDGIHDRVSVVQFPLMQFKVYKELGRLLQEYYNARGHDSDA